MAHKAVPSTVIHRMRLLRARGLLIRQIAADVGLVNSTVSRLLSEPPANSERRSRTVARMRGRSNPNAGPPARVDVVEYARQQCPTALPLLARLRGRP